jgi:hypothetical protein
MKDIKQKRTILDLIDKRLGADGWAFSRKIFPVFRFNLFILKGNKKDFYFNRG